MDGVRRYCNRQNCAGCPELQTDQRRQQQSSTQSGGQQQHKQPPSNTPGISTQILFVEPNFVKGPSEYETFYDCCSENGLLEIPSAMSRVLTTMEDPGKFRGTLKRVVCTSHKLLKCFDEASKKQQRHNDVQMCQCQTNAYPSHGDNDCPANTHNRHCDPHPFTIPVTVQLQYPMPQAPSPSNTAAPPMEPIGTSSVAATRSPNLLAVPDRLDSKTANGARSGESTPIPVQKYPEIAAASTLADALQNCKLLPIMEPGKKLGKGSWQPVVVHQLHTGSGKCGLMVVPQPQSRYQSETSQIEANQSPRYPDIIELPPENKYSRTYDYKMVQHKSRSQTRHPEKYYNCPFEYKMVEPRSQSQSRHPGKYYNCTWNMVASKPQTLPQTQHPEKPYSCTPERNMAASPPQPQSHYPEKHSSCTCDRNMVVPQPQPQRPEKHSSCTCDRNMVAPQSQPQPQRPEKHSSCTCDRNMVAPQPQIQPQRPEKHSSCTCDRNMVVPQPQPQPQRPEKHSSCTCDCNMVAPQPQIQPQRPEKHSSCTCDRNMVAPQPQIQPQRPEKHSSCTCDCNMVAPQPQIQPQRPEKHSSCTCDRNMVVPQPQPQPQRPEKHSSCTCDCNMVAPQTQSQRPEKYSSCTCDWNMVAPPFLPQAQRAEKSYNCTCERNIMAFQHQAQLQLPEKNCSCAYERNMVASQPQSQHPEKRYDCTYNIVLQSPHPQPHPPAIEVVAKPSPECCYGLVIGPGNPSRVQLPTKDPAAGEVLPQANQKYTFRHKHMIVPEPQPEPCVGPFYCYCVPDVEPRYRQEQHPSQIPAESPPRALKEGTRKVLTHDRSTSVSPSASVGLQGLPCIPVAYEGSAAVATNAPVGPRRDPRVPAEISSNIEDAMAQRLENCRCMQKAISHGSNTAISPSAAVGPRNGPCAKHLPAEMSNNEDAVPQHLENCRCMQKAISHGSNTAISPSAAVGPRNGPCAKHLPAEMSYTEDAVPQNLENCRCMQKAISHGNTTAVSPSAAVGPRNGPCAKHLPAEMSNNEDAVPQHLENCRCMQKPISHGNTTAVSPSAAVGPRNGPCAKHLSAEMSNNEDAVPQHLENCRCMQKPISHGDTTAVSPSAAVGPRNGPCAKHLPAEMSNNEDAVPQHLENCRCMQKPISHGNTTAVSPSASIGPRRVPGIPVAVSYEGSVAVSTDASLVPRRDPRVPAETSSNIEDAMPQRLENCRCMQNALSHGSNTAISPGASVGPRRVPCVPVETAPKITREMPQRLGTCPCMQMNVSREDNAAVSPCASVGLRRDQRSPVEAAPKCSCMQMAMSKDIPVSSVPVASQCCQGDSARSPIQECKCCTGKAVPHDSSNVTMLETRTSSAIIYCNIRCDDPVSIIDCPAKQRSTLQRRSESNFELICLCGKPDWNAEPVASEPQSKPVVPQKTTEPKCECRVIEIPQKAPLPSLFECKCTAPPPECPCLAEDDDLENKLEEIICQCQQKFPLPTAPELPEHSELPVPPVPPPKPKRVSYRLATPQHADLHLCTPCRYDPSPLVDENGRVFCPFSCGCCLCPWKPRATESFEDRLKHQKIKVCKCRERGNIFEKFNRKEIGCSTDSFFDVCPCREKAEAKFLEMNGYEMWTIDDKLSDQTSSRVVTLDEIVEILPSPPRSIQSSFS